MDELAKLKAMIGDHSILSLIEQLIQTVGPTGLPLLIAYLQSLLPKTPA